MFIVSCRANVEAEIIDGIAAVVNDDIILQSELLQLLEPYRREYGEKYSGNELNDRIRATARSLLEAAIERHLLRQEALKRGIEIEESKIDEAVKKVRERFDSDEDFRKALAELGETMATFRKKREEELLARRMLALKLQDIDKEVTILEQDVQDYYEEHKEDFATEPKAELLKILVSAEKSLPPDERSRRRDVIEKASAEIKGGADFERIAERLAEGGTGVPIEVDRGDVPAELERAVSAMQDGEVSDVLESEQGFYIVKVMRLDAQGPSQNAELRARIESILREQRVQEKWTEWLKKLRDNARVSIYFR